MMKLNNNYLFCSSSSRMNENMREKQKKNIYIYIMKRARPTATIYYIKQQNTNTNQTQKLKFINQIYKYIIFQNLCQCPAYIQECIHKKDRGNKQQQ